MFIHSSSMMDISYPAWTLLFVLFGLVLVEPHNGGISVNNVHAFLLLYIVSPANINWNLLWKWIYTNYKTKYVAP